MAVVVFAQVFDCTDGRGENVKLEIPHLYKFIWKVKGRHCQKKPHYS